MQDQREPWQKPKMIVLVRSEQAEDVLTYCKATVTGGIPGQNVNRSYCRRRPGTGTCNACSQRTSRWS
jgi:hypothetical protein